MGKSGKVQLVTKMKCALCIGGSPIARQIELLKEKPVIVIGAARLVDGQAVQAKPATPPARQR
jgi:superfamily II DNA/RNA helicase